MSGAAALDGGTSLALIALFAVAAWLLLAWVMRRDARVAAAAAASHAGHGWERVYVRSDALPGRVCMDCSCGWIGWVESDKVA